MRHKSTFVSAALIAALIAAAPASAQTAIGDLNASREITIEGRVTDVFGNKFVLEDDSGRVLVETGPAWWRSTEVSVDENLTVIGEPGASRTFDAFKIRHGDGREIVIREPNMPPPWAGQESREGRAVDDDTDRRLQRRADTDDQRQIDAALSRGIDLKKITEDAGYVFGYDVDRKKNHYEVEAYSADGVEVELHIDFTGNIRRIAMDDPTYDQAGLRQIVENAGYQWRGDVDRKKKHYEVEAVNRYGERVELHVDYSGEIYKEKWD
ncbi:hypothetical protein PZ895_15240 [Mesorhizobium sp. YIM 152430]|uniref:hypothetical protein n=1 Tax=Mesorhizobium sp. YIM 152430 TaxID=3031761 RepID=UPI0023DADAD3|nr:hypothetical protein [Mesorhizobium sp. YIM 152430]MDF1601115.1 hypothetical protein [Mesorhizobium sp. YIM 152430]